MSLISELLRSAHEREKRVGKARTAVAALTYDEKGLLVAEVLRELKAGPPKPARGRKAEAVNAEPETHKKTVRERVIGALSEASPLNVAGIHAVIDRVVPGAVSKATVAAEVSAMLGKGLLAKADVAGRGASFTLANGQGGAAGNPLS